jgi:hypothetical protein
VPISAKSTRVTFDDAVKDVVNGYAINGKKSKDTVERKAELYLNTHLRRPNDGQHHHRRRARSQRSGSRLERRRLK